MKPRRSRIQVILGQFLLATLVVNGLVMVTGSVPTVQAQNGKPIIISFGQPNIWSLEQAHYLLARLRARSLDLQSKDLAAGDLDPNEVTGARLESLKTMLGISAGFNQATGLQNDQARKELAFNQDRRHQLLALRDQRQADARAVTDQLATLRVEREKMNTDNTSAEVKKLKDVEIEQQVQRQTQINGEVTSLTSEINGITAPGTTLATTSPPSATASPLPNSIIDKLLGSDDAIKAQLGNLPKVDASTKLDNYLNLQYEIIAKQLTLLRDEVGPGQRLVFLELPQSFYTVPDKSNRMVAQVWWHLDGYYERTSTGKSKLDVPDDCVTNKKSQDSHDDELVENPAALSNRLRCNPYGAGRSDSVNEILRGIADYEGTIRAYKNAQKNTVENLSNLDWKFHRVAEPVTKPEKDLRGDEPISEPDRTMRTLDLIPRQSALNVNDIQDRQKNFNLMGLFTWLSGLGVSVNYQREQRLYQQFIQQEIYASAFGKGKADFGWTFGARPGNDRIAPGLQTTYAVLVVPEKAETISLKARGCYFPRTTYAPNNYSDLDSPAAISSSLRCDGTPEARFNLVVPSTNENNFWVTGLKYRSVRPGERATVYVSGDYFSPQIGVLVNGVALRHSIGLAQSELALPRRDNGFDPAPIGDFEFVNSKLLVLSFSIPNFKGTPSIALVTPGRARVINDLRLVINDSYKCAKDDLKEGRPNCPPNPNNPKIPVTYKKMSEDKNVDEEYSIWVTLDKQRPMFSESSPAPVLAVENLSIFGPAPYKHTFTGNLIGSHFLNGDEVRVNGRPIEAACTANGSPVDCSGQVCRDSSKKIVDCDKPSKHSCEGANGKSQPCYDETTVKVVRSCSVEGIPVACPKIIAPGLLEFEFPATNAPSLEVTVVHTDKNPENSVYATHSFPNPLALRVDRVTILSSQPDKKPFPTLSIQLEGIGFSSLLAVRSFPDGIARIRRRTQSATNMVLEMELLKFPEFIQLELFDPRTGLYLPVVVANPVEAPKKDAGKTQTQPAKPAPATTPAEADASTQPKPPAQTEATRRRSRRHRVRTDPPPKL
jgi:hypothetical protein